MLDTNICVFLLKGKALAYFEKLEKLEQEKHHLTISSIVLSELQYGVSNSQHKEKNQINLDTLLGRLEVLPYTEECAYFYGEIRSHLKNNGNLIGGNDVFIASHAIAKEAVLVTNNTKEFQRVPNLRLEYWE